MSGQNFKRINVFTQFISNWVYRLVLRLVGWVIINDTFVGMLSQFCCSGDQKENWKLVVFESLSGKLNSIPTWVIQVSSRSWEIIQFMTTLVQFQNSGGWKVQQIAETDGFGSLSLKLTTYLHLNLVCAYVGWVNKMDKIRGNLGPISPLWWPKNYHGLEN